LTDQRSVKSHRPPPRKRFPPRPKGDCWRRLANGGWDGCGCCSPPPLAYGGFRYYESARKKKEAAAQAQAARQAHRAVTVAASAARVGNIPIYLRGLGNVAAFNTVNVKPRVDGPLIAVNYREGQDVKQGDVLVEIDPRTFQAALDQALGQLARDQAQIHDAEVNLARYQALWEAKVIAKQQLDTQAAQVGQFKGTIESDQAAIDNARLQLSFTRVLAPLSGRVGLRPVDVGNIVHASDQNPLVVITQMQPIAVVFTIPADSLPPVLAKLRAGAKLPVDAYDRSDTTKIASGIFETVDNTIDQSTGTSRLKAIFDNNDRNLFPNQFVNCRLLIDTHRNSVIVPASAVQRGPQGPYVYLVKPDGTAAMQTVTQGITEGTDVEITSGVAAGDTVVTDGQDKLEPGGKIEVRPDGGGAVAGQVSNPPNKAGKSPNKGGGRSR